MYIPGIVLSLIVSASAIDIRLYLGEGCTGNFVVCADARPNTCCGGGGTNYSSVGFSGITADQRVRCQGMGPGGCKGFPIKAQTSTSDFVCLDDGGYYSATYDFGLAERAAEADAASIAQRQDVDWNKVDYDLGGVDWNDVDFNPRDVN